MALVCLLLIKLNFKDLSNNNGTHAAKKLLNSIKSIPYFNVLLVVYDRYFVK